MATLRRYLYVTYCSCIKGCSHTWAVAESRKVTCLFGEMFKVRTRVASIHYIYIHIFHSCNWEWWNLVCATWFLNSAIPHLHLLVVIASSFWSGIIFFSSHISSKYIHALVWWHIKIWQHTCNAISLYEAFYRWVRMMCLVLGTSGYGKGGKWALDDKPDRHVWYVLKLWDLGPLILPVIDSSLYSGTRKRENQSTVALTSRTSGWHLKVTYSWDVSFCLAALRIYILSSP